MGGGYVCKKLRVHTLQIKENLLFYIELLRLSNPPYSSNVASEDVHLYHSLHHVIAESLLNDATRWKLALIIILPK